MSEVFDDGGVKGEKIETKYEGFNFNQNVIQYV
jgi:hypothetical protein